MIQIQISDEDYLKSHNFAEKCAETCIANYRRRGQGSLEKITTDIHTGKLVELGAYNFLKSIGVEVTFPDFEIYKSKGKSWDADLVNNKYKFHCKGQNQESVTKYGASWILQWGGRGKGHTDKLFKHQEKHDYLIPGFTQGRSAVICGIYQIKNIMENGLIAEPKVDWLKFSKRAIYLADLEAHYAPEERWSIFYEQVKDTFKL